MKSCAVCGGENFQRLIDTDEKICLPKRGDVQESVGIDYYACVNCGYINLHLDDASLEKVKKYNSL